MFELIYAFTGIFLGFQIITIDVSTNAYVSIKVTSRFNSTLPLINEVILKTY